jgi:hypothetical protein
MKRAALSVATLVLAAGGALYGMTGASANPVAHTGPSVVVTPSTGLQNGSQVTVSGSGFLPGDNLYVLECQVGASAAAQCYIDLNNLITVNADGSGNVAPVKLTVYTGVIGTTTCGTSSADLSNCEVGLTNQDGTDAASQTVTFLDPSATTTTTSTVPSSTTTTAPPTTTTTGPGKSAKPHLTVAPNTNLHNRQAVKVSGSGFKAGDHIFITECKRGATGAAGCKTSGVVAVTVKSNGHFGPVTFKALTGKIGNTVCGTKKTNVNGCQIVAGNASGGDSAVAKISFKKP